MKNAFSGSNLFYAFDLDGTVTACEMLPILGKELGLEAELAHLTSLTLAGTIDFALSFRLRFDLLRDISLDRVRSIVRAIPVDPHIAAFIARHKENCAIITGNLDVWVEPLSMRLGCQVLSSRSSMASGRLELASVLDKRDAIRSLARPGRHIVAVGESFSDIAMFEEANTGIAFAGVHQPVPQLMRAADYVAPDGIALCHILNTLQNKNAAFC